MRSLAAALLLLSACARADTNWREDVRFLGRELPRRHANAFHRIAKEDFVRAIAAAEAKAETASDEEMFVELSRITASVGDGHTYVQIPPTAHRLPIGVSAFDGQYRVTHTVEAYRAALGTQLVRIESTPVTTAIERLSPLLPQGENDAYVKTLVLGWLMLGEALRGTGVARSADHATYVFKRDDGTEISIDVASMPWSEKPTWVFATENLALSRQRPNETFWFQAVGPKAVYVAFRGYNDLRGKSRELWSYVDANGVEKVIVDLRTNGGGDYTKGRAFIVDELKKRPRLRSYALIGARTFSAAMNNAVDLRNAGAKLVGSPIGEKPNSYQENDEVKLPSSKLVLSYSTRFYKFVPDDAPNIVAPDKEIQPTWADFLAGKDPALDWALADGVR